MRVKFGKGFLGVGHEGESISCTNAPQIVGGLD